MEFLDPKEQVIDLELTSYGRFMLSQGKFDPKIYAFFDNDVVYDSRFAQTGSDPKIKELQNSIEGRIQQEDVAEAGGSPLCGPRPRHRGRTHGIASIWPSWWSSRAQCPRCKEAR